MQNTKVMLRGTFKETPILKSNVFLNYKKINQLTNSDNGSIRNRIIKINKSIQKRVKIHLFINQYIDADTGSNISIINPYTG